MRKIKRRTQDITYLQKDFGIGFWKLFIVFLIYSSYWLISKSWKLPIWLFYCSHQGHDWRLESGGWIWERSKRPFYCKRCGYAIKDEKYYRKYGNRVRID